MTPFSEDPPGSSPPPEADLSRIRTVPVAERANKVAAKAFAAPPVAGGSFREFLDSIPGILQGDDLRAVARGLAEAARAGRGVLWMFGGAVVKTGLAPLLVRMMDRGAATFLAGNGSVAIHDYEVARWGATSEDVEAGLTDGTFGMAEETGREINEAVTRGAREGMGFGEALGWALAQRDDLVAPERSLLLQAYRRGIPVGIHAAMGCEITHQHPSADGAAHGDCSLRDFRRMAGWLESIHGGGAVVNVGSAVIMPEVFLKALTVARNLNQGRPREFMAVDFDQTRQYRSWMNVVQRPTRTGGGKGYHLTGRHEIMIPLLAWAVEEELAGTAGAESGAEGPEGSDARAG